MKESYTEGIANHGDPESCGGVRKDAAEALTGAHTGGVLSRENRRNQGADDVVLCGRQQADARYGECVSHPARSETSSTCGNSRRENREIPQPPTGNGPEGRAGKAKSRNPAMYGCGKSDNSILPAKPPNKVAGATAEVVEGRGLTKENADQQKHVPDAAPGRRRAKCAGTYIRDCSGERTERSHFEEPTYPNRMDVSVPWV